MNIYEEKTSIKTIRITNSLYFNGNLMDEDYFNVNVYNSLGEVIDKVENISDLSKPAISNKSSASVIWL